MTCGWQRRLYGSCTRSSPVRCERADRAAGEQRAVVLRDVDLAGLAAQRVDARIERPVAAARRVDRQRADDERRFEHRLEREQRVQRERGRDLRAVDQRQAFLRRRARAARCRRASSACGGRHALAVDAAPRLRRSAPASGAPAARGRRRRRPSPGRACTGTRPALCSASSVSMTSCAHAGVAARQARRLQQPASAARPRRRSGSPTPTAVRADQVELQRRELVFGDARAGQLAEAGVDAVDRRVALRRRAARPRRWRASPARAAGVERRARTPPAQMRRSCVERQLARARCVSVAISAPASAGSRPCSRAQAIARLVAGIGVAHHAGAGVVPQHALDALRGRVACRRRRSPRRRAASSPCRRRRRGAATPRSRRRRC